MIEDNQNLIRKVSETASALREKLGWNNLAAKPKIAIVLGSGLGIFCDALQNKIEVPYGDLPHMPNSSVPGHAGKWVFGVTAAGIPVLAQQGRVHYYEGYDLSWVTFPIRVIAKLGLQHIILTNAAGSVNPEYRPGDFVLLDDHINLTAHSPLHGLFNPDTNNPELGPRFVDLSEPYDLTTNTLLHHHCTADRPEIRIHRGTYAGVTGPQYETRAEVRMIAKLGGDVVGMSTVSETIVAKQCGLKVSGLSCVTNFGCGLGTTPLNHEEVAEMGKKRAPEFCWILEELFGLLNKS